VNSLYLAKICHSSFKIVLNILLNRKRCFITLSNGKGYAVANPYVCDTRDLRFVYISHYTPNIGEVRSANGFRLNPLQFRGNYIST